MSGFAYQAEQLKQQGNAHFKDGEYDLAAELYGKAIQKNSSNPLLYTNRANARLKLRQWQEVIDDCIRSIELLSANMKAYFYLAQAQLELHHPNEALSSALRAYELCIASPAQTSSAFTISNLVLRCKRAKWDLRERNRLRQRQDLLSELLDRLDEGRRLAREEFDAAEARGEMGSVEGEERRGEVEAVWDGKAEELRNVYALADPANYERREVPEFLVDDISFEIMHDPVVTKHGHSYERATIVEHLKRNPVDPLTREPLSLADLRPNLALRKACDLFWEQNRGWAYEW